MFGSVCIQMKCRHTVLRCIEWWNKGENQFKGEAALIFFIILYYRFIPIQKDLLNISSKICVGKIVDWNIDFPKHMLDCKYNAVLPKQPTTRNKDSIWGNRD